MRYNDVPPEVYRGFGFPGAEDLGNMFQFKRDFERDFCGARDLEVARALNPSLQTFDAAGSRPTRRASRSGSVAASPGMSNVGARGHVSRPRAVDDHAPRKRYGQHFLVDPHYVARIVDAIAPPRGDNLVEIGSRALPR